MEARLNVRAVYTGIDFESGDVFYAMSVVDSTGQEGDQIISEEMYTSLLRQFIEEQAETDPDFKARLREAHEQQAQAAIPMAVPDRIAPAPAAPTEERVRVEKAPRRRIVSVQTRVQPQPQADEAGFQPMPVDGTGK